MINTVFCGGKTILLLTTFPDAIFATLGKNSSVDRLYLISVIL